MKTLTHPAMLALGAAVLCLSCHIAPFISPLHPVIFHVAGSPYSVFVPVLINLFALWLVLTLLLWLGRNPGRLHTLVWTGLMVMLPLALTENWFAQRVEQIPLWLNVVMGLSPLLVLAFFLIASSPSYAPLFQKAQNFTAVVLAFVSLSASLVMVQFLWRFWQARTVNREAVYARDRRLPLTPHGSRVIWILFDELSYQQVYERRFPGLALPAFDRLAQQSVVFTHAVPTAISTEIAIPSLITGMPSDQVRLAGDGRGFSLHNPVDSAWRRFDERNTVFQDALDAGYKTAVAGWYNPYCRILPQVLDDCFWSDYTPFRVEMFSRQPIWWNSLQIPLYYFESAYSWLYASRLWPSSERNAIRFHKADYTELTAAADKLLNDSSMDFVFLHLPVPHPGGIYDRTTGSFAEKPSSYVDNLALADACLAHFRSLLEQRREWDSSAVIVMGDHSWRTHLIRRSPGWSDVDELASHHGQFDDRPAYIVKLPNEQSPVSMDTAFAAVHTRALFDEILAGRISAPAELTAWAKQQQ